MLGGSALCGAGGADQSAFAGSLKTVTEPAADRATKGLESPTERRPDQSKLSVEFSDLHFEPGGQNGH